MATRTTVIMSPRDEHALREASRREGVTQSALIRRGIRLVTERYVKQARPTVGWLKLTRAERTAILADEFGDLDA